MGKSVSIVRGPSLRKDSHENQQHGNYEFDFIGDLHADWGWGFLLAEMSNSQTLKTNLVMRWAEDHKCRAAMLRACSTCPTQLRRIETCVLEKVGCDDDRPMTHFLFLSPFHSFSRKERCNSFPVFGWSLSAQEGSVLVFPSYRFVERESGNKWILSRTGIVSKLPIFHEAQITTTLLLVKTCTNSFYLDLFPKLY